MLRVPDRNPKAIIPGDRKLIANMTATDEAVLYSLPTSATVDDLDPDQAYLGTVNGIVEYGVFVDLSDGISGLVHDSNLAGEYTVGDDIALTLETRRENGDLSFRELPIDPEQARIEAVARGTATTVADLDEHLGETVRLQGRLAQITQTGGPTVFHLNDGTGVVPCTAFVDPGVRAYPDLDRDAIVTAIGSVERHDGDLQLEVDELTPLSGGERHAVADRVTDRLETTATPASIEPLVDWPALDPLVSALEPVAEQLRRSLLERRPIWIRHHADGDGLCASVPVHRALERFAATYHEDSDTGQHLLRRLPSKAPFYELEDSTRDLAQALEDRARHGQQLPLVLMLDNGSTGEDTPAYETLRHYDVPIVAIDHHHPDPDAVNDLVEHHVNPYLYGEDYRITTGMMAVELARMIDPTITDDIRHLPAVAGISDRSSADAMEAYQSLAASAGYDMQDLHAISDALDYAAYQLRYNAGRHLIHDILGLTDSPARHRELVDQFATHAREAIDDQLELALPHVETQSLSNDVDLYQIDVENYARRFTYPAPGKTTGVIHDHMVAEHGDPAITIGYGPDFAVLRSDGVRLDIPEMVSELDEGIVGGGISGGGHLVVGSLNFVSGRREEVFESLIQKMSNADVDTTLSSTASRFNDR